MCLGSGSLAAMAVFEDRYRPDMEVGLFSHWPFFSMFFILERNNHDYDEFFSLLLRRRRQSAWCVMQ